MTAKAIALTLTTVAACAAISPLAEARSTDLGSVRACSKFGSKCVTARVRMTNLGPQYLSPGGNWTWCEADCRDTLRRDTVDFWEDQRERGK